MEKAYNGFYKAVYIICLIVAICASIAFVAGLIILINGINDPITINVMNEYGEMVEEVLAPETVASYLLSFELTLAGYCVLNYCAYAGFKKYAYMPEEEVQLYRNKIVTWIVVFFLVDGLIVAILSLIGLLRKKKSENVEEKESPETSVTEPQNNPVQEAKPAGDAGLDKMIERLEKLNKLKEMGAISDAEYEKLRQTIVSKM